MQLNELKQYIKNLEVDYLIEGKLGRSVPSYNYIEEAEAIEDRANRGKSNARMTKEEKIISTANGLLCSHFLTKLSCLEAEQ